MKKFFSRIGHALNRDKWYALGSVTLFGVSLVFFSFNSTDPELLAKRDFLAGIELNESIKPTLSEFSDRVNVVENVFTELNYNPRLSESSLNDIGSKLVTIIAYEKAYKNVFNDLDLSVSNGEVSQFKKDIQYELEKDRTSAEETVHLDILKTQTIINKLKKTLTEEASKKITEDDLKKYYEENKDVFLIDRNVSFYSEKFLSKEELEASKKIIEKEKSFKSILSEEEFVEKSVVLKNVQDPDLKDLLAKAKSGDIISNEDEDIFTLYLITNVVENKHVEFEMVKDVIKEELIAIYVREKLEEILK